MRIKYNGEQDVKKVIPVQALGVPGVSSQTARQRAYKVVRSTLRTDSLYRQINIPAPNSC